jgi:hypothetical protein
MQMIRHDNKVVQPKLLGRDVRTKHIDHQSGIPFGLQQGPALAGPGGGEERARGTPGVLGLGITRGSRHSQGLKPDSFPQRYGTAQAVP